MTNKITLNLEPWDAHENRMRLIAQPYFIAIATAASQKKTKKTTATSRGNHHLNWNTIIYSRYKQMYSILLYGKLNLASYNRLIYMDSYLQRLKVRLQEWDWLDEGKNIKVSQSEAEQGGSIPFPTWDATGDLQILQRRRPPSPNIYSIYIFFTDLHDSRVWPISSWKLWISPKGYKFAPLLPL